MLLLPRSKESLESRLALIDSAVSSLDMQYFIWSSNAAGVLLMDRVIAAADRGVRVRLIVDDVFLVSSTGFTSVDPFSAAFSAHPNISLKIFNPGKYRSGVVGLAGNYIGTYKRFNPRMHNKLIVADGQFAMVGGRNLGSEYFGLADKYNFLDMDLLVTGPVVAEVMRGFDVYWQAELAYPATHMAEADEDDFEQFRAGVLEMLEDSRDVLVSYPVDVRDWSDWWAALPSRMVPGEAWYVQDPPMDDDSPNLRLYSLLTEGFDNQAQKIGRAWYVTAYLIPNQQLLDDLKRDIAAGREVNMLTNSLASNNHTAASAQYSKFRDELLEAGVNLYELKHQPSAEIRALVDVEPVSAKFIVLHTKVAIGDNGECFVGSLNLDPRALDINTENGMGIYSPVLCGELLEQSRTLFEPENAWHVTQDEDGGLLWTSDEGTVQKQPARGLGQRFGHWFYRLLPLQGEL